MSARLKNRCIDLLFWSARTAAAPLLVFYFSVRGWRDPRYFRRFGERLGAAPRTFQPTPAGGVWLHAVSVGEVLSAVRLAQELRARCPALPLHLTTGTVAGRDLADSKAAAIADSIAYLPLDYVFAIRRVLRRVRPAAVVMLETEIWPVLFRESKRAGCAVLIVNGRISDRALPRYRRFRWMFRAALSRVDRILAQTEHDRERFVAIGAPPDRTVTAGNMKYDAAPATSTPPVFVHSVVAALAPAVIWIAASTMPPLAPGDPDEDHAVIASFQALAAQHPRLLLIIAPRKPERFDLAARKLAAAGVRFLRRSSGAMPPGLQLPCVLLLDTIGELASCFPLADVVFVGGTLASRGGHNVLEPAAAGRAIVIGPHMENFAAVAGEFTAAGALVNIACGADLTAAIGRLLSSEAERGALGSRARAIAEANRGAVARAAAAILDARDRAVPQYPHTLIWRIVGGALSLVWRAGSAIEQRRQIARARSLATPVISVGGLAMGGTGKTPFVLLLAGLLKEHGLKTAILTRGYKRASTEDLVVEPGGRAAPEHTGDEARVFIASRLATVGIGADRWRVGKLVEERARPDIFLLDDGFQHRRLKRDLDIVLIDALDPFAGGVFPLGRLREPVSALARSDVIVLTRCEPGRTYAGLTARIRTLNKTAPIIRTRVKAGDWIAAATGERVANLDLPTVAFCGIGNPDAFLMSLREKGIAPIATRIFRDHHKYTAEDLAALQELARGAVLVTTQKDIMNLPHPAPPGIYWLESTMELLDEYTLPGIGVAYK